VGVKDEEHMSDEPPAHDDEDLRVYRYFSLFFMALYLAFFIGLVTVPMAWLLSHPLTEGLTVALWMAPTLMVLGLWDDELREDWFEGTAEDWRGSEEKSREKPERPDDGYYGW